MNKSTRIIDWKSMLIMLFIVLSVLSTIYIFHNSMQNSNVSMTRSEQVAEQVKPLIDSQNSIDENTFHIFIRKSAHIIEFAVLGVLLSALMFSIHYKHRRWFVFMPLFFALAVCVSDEFIQSFTTRTSIVSDILIDFSGALGGMLLTAITVGIAHLIKKGTGKRRSR